MNQPKPKRSSAVQSQPKPTTKAKQPKKYRQRLMKYAGKAKGLPPDASRNLEHRGFPQPHG